MIRFLYVVISTITFLAISFNASAQGVANISFWVKDASDRPIDGAKIEGSCSVSYEESGFFSSKNHTLNNDYSCTTDKDGLCSFTINTVKAYSRYWRPCDGTKDTTVRIGDKVQVVLPQDQYNNKFNKFLSFLTRGRHGEDAAEYLVLTVADGETKVDRFSSQTQYKQTLLQHTLANYKNLITLKDDDLETSATLSTLNAHNKETDSSLADIHFIRAFINKQSAKPTVQVYIVDEYSRERANGFRRYNLASFATPNGPMSTELIRIDSKVRGLRRASS